MEPVEMEKRSAPAGVAGEGNHSPQREARFTAGHRQGPWAGASERPLKRAVFCGGKSLLDKIYAKGRREKIAALASLYPHVVDLENFDEHADYMREVEVIFSTWGFPRFTAAHLDRMPNLKALFYAAGTVQSFAAPYIERNITVVSAWRANAVPVSEFVLSQILLSTKGYFRKIRKPGWAEGAKDEIEAPGNFGETVAILGAGAIGTRVIELLRDYELRVVVYDPFLNAERAADLGVERVSLEGAFERGAVVSNHLANLAETRGLLAGRLFARMRHGATFINTGRGATVDEPAMIAVLEERQDLTALLDVTEPEPPLPDSPLRRMPNVFLSGHIAGSMQDELVRMADYCIEDFSAMIQHRPLRHAVSAAMLKTMA